MLQSFVFTPAAARAATVRGPAALSAVTSLQFDCIASVMLPDACAVDPTDETWHDLIMGRS
jgi:hypothetical protein